MNKKGNVVDKKKRIRKEHVITYLFIFVLLSISIFGLYFINNKFTGFAVYTQSNQTEFDLGTYSNTEYNGSAVVLAGENTTGTYTSKIFDAGNDAVWNNLSWSSNEPNLESFFCVDGGGEVFKSGDAGVTWIMTKENYGRTTDGADMFSNEDAIYILAQSNKEVYKSTDSGVTWSVVNDTFTTNSLLVGATDSNNNLYIATGPGEVYKSTDSGVTWSFLSDFNSGTQDAKGITINSSDDIYIVDGVGDVYSSTDDGDNWTKVNDSYGGSTGTDGLEVDSNNNLYILINSDVYESTDSGVTWSKINDDFSPYSNDGMEISIDSNDNLYIADGVGRIFKSTNSGVDWSEIGDCNNAASSSPKGFITFIESSSLDIQVKSCNDDACAGETWTDITDISPQDLSLDNNNYFQYQVNFTSPDSSVSPSLESVSIDYDLVNQAPTITLVAPQNGATYGYNESLALNFVVFDSDDNLDSCWYNIDDGNNISLTGCANTSFDVSGDGSYVLSIYANDTYGEQVSDSATFNVQVGAPTIELNSPIDVYLNSNDVVFRYIPTDMDLDSCELWGNFNGNWEINQTDNSPTSGSENTFSLSLEDGTYLWNIKCSDSVGNSAFNGNKTFYVDTINPSISLTEPSGAKTSRTVTASWSVSDASSVSCKYNVYRGESLEIANTSVNCSLDSTVFDVTVDADFIFNFYVNDSAGNKDNASSSFGVDTSTPPPPSNGEGGSSGGGSSSSSSGIPYTPITVGDISNIISNPGETKELSLSVKNGRFTFLQDCQVIGDGEHSDWFGSSETKSLAAGESYEFSFDLKIPEVSEPNTYNLSVKVVCGDLSKGVDFNLEIIEQKLSFDLIKVERITEEEIKIIYLLEELSGLEQSINLQFLLFNSDNEKISEVSETRIVSADSKQEFEILIPIEPLLEGELSLLVNLNSETYSTFVQENIILGAPISGFSVFGDKTGGTDNIISLILIVLFFVFAFFMVRRILKHRKKKK